MAKKETNDAKRGEIQTLVAAAVARGWTNATLAAYFGVSSFLPYANGTSMGTNLLRAQIGRLPSFAAELVVQRIAELQAMITGAEAALAKAQAMEPKSEAAWRSDPQMKDWIEKYPEIHTYERHLKGFAQNKEWHINKAENQLAQAKKWLNALTKATR